MAKRTTNGEKPAPRFRISDLNEMLDLAIIQMSEEDMSAAAVAITAIGGRYTPRNRMIMFIQRPTVRAVAGLKEWRSRGRAVRKGEKGIAFLAPIKRKPTNPDSPGDQQTATPAAPAENGPAPANAETDQDAERRMCGVRVGYVWDISQTDPLPGAADDPAAAAGDVSEPEFTPEDVAELIEEIQEQAEQAAARRSATAETSAGASAEQADTEQPATRRRGELLEIQA